MTLVFQKKKRDFDPLSRYIEEKADAEMPSVVFDELYQIYEERFQVSNQLSTSLHNSIVLNCMIEKENLKVRE